MTAEQRKRQQAEYTRSLLDAVYEPDRIRQRQTTLQRRFNRQQKQHKEHNDRQQEVG